jgi:hypothetical protein
MGNGNPTEADMIAAGETIRISSRRGKQIIEEIRQQIAENYAEPC